MLLDITFTCECGNNISETVKILEPNYAAKKVLDSEVESINVVLCKCCGKENEIYVINDISKAYCLLNYDLDDEVSYAQPYLPPQETEFDWYSEEPDHYTIFKGNIESIRKVLRLEFPEDSLFNFLLMTYGHTVAVIESYLVGAFIYQVTNSDKLIKKLVEADPELGELTFTLKEIYEQQSKVKSVVAEFLQNLIFHNMNKIKPMYRNVLGYDLGDIDWLFQAISLRHDCVHRAGFKKGGEVIELSVADVHKLIDKAESLIKNYEETLKKAPET